MTPGPNLKEGVMPKEKIHLESEPYEPVVGWAQDRDVQLGVEATGERSLFWTLFSGADQREQLGRAVAEALEVDTDTSLFKDSDAESAHFAAMGERALDALDTASHGGYRGVWSDLTRYEVNRLIKVLRRARDSAYGKDE